MSEEFTARVSQFNEAVNEAIHLLSIVRASELQKAAIDSLSQLRPTLAAWKKEAVERKSEDEANAILGMECVLGSLCAEFEMWLLLKAEEPNKAWDCLVVAQMKASDAVRAHKAFAHVMDRVEWLDGIEHFVFPPQMFVSAGLLVDREVCTICGSEYQECPHLVGKPYWGEFCFRHLTGVRVNHVSIVSEPANKTCRITDFSVDGGKRNRMTWRVEPTTGNEQTVGDGKGLVSNVKIMDTNDLVC